MQCHSMLKVRLPANILSLLMPSYFTVNSSLNSNSNWVRVDNESNQVCEALNLSAWFDTGDVTIDWILQNRHEKNAAIASRYCENYQPIVWLLFFLYCDDIVLWVFGIVTSLFNTANNSYHTSRRSPARTEKPAFVCFCISVSVLKKQQISITDSYLTSKSFHRINTPTGLISCLDRLLNPPGVSICFFSSFHTSLQWLPLSGSVLFSTAEFCDGKHRF